ncbi:MAG: tail fiber protein [Allosphingosinicella sp.]
MSDSKTNEACAPIMAAAGPPVLAISQLLDTGGTLPNQWPPRPPEANNVRAMVHGFGGDFRAYGAPPCIGEQLSISDNMDLYGILSDSYGGDGATYFNLPDLNGRVAAGGAKVGLVSDGSLAMTYMIAADSAGWGANPMFGQIGLFAGTQPPSGWLVADGSSLPINENQTLYEVIGTGFGGDGTTHFNLPNLQRRVAIGAGAGPGLAPVALGEVVDNGAYGMVPGLGLTYLISTVGAYPERGDGDGGFPPLNQTIGEIVAFAGPGLPPWRGWALCDGSLLPIEGNTALFSVLLNRFGGDGVKTFALPDLRGRMIVGTAG